MSYRVELSEWARKDFNRRREFSRSMLAGSARLWENRDMEKYAVVIHEDPQGGVLGGSARSSWLLFTRRNYGGGDGVRS